MAQTQDRMDEYALYASTAETVGIPYEWLSPTDIKDRWPLIRTDDLKGAIYHPTDGYINPADVTQAMAKGARQHGASIERKTQVDSYEWTGSEWIVRGTRMVEQGGNLIMGAEKFEIRAEHVVTATGNHAQRTAKQLGIKMPAIPVEHTFIVLDQDPALLEWRKNNPEHPVIRDADAQSYVREERGGWILGTYERGAPARFEHGHGDDPPGPFLRSLWIKRRFQWSYLLYSRWKSACWACSGPDQHVARRRVFLWHNSRRWDRLLFGANDDGRGSRD